MNNRYEGVKCPVCNGYLFEDADDIVVCPICGAPHHRACYQSLGHCGVEALHGTEQQYDRAQNAKAKAEHTEKQGLHCPSCGRSLSEEMLFCPHCGKMRGEPAQTADKYPFFVHRADPLGGVHPATDLGEGVTAKQAAEFIKVNTMRYIPKFASDAKASWNWLAFLLPHSFFFFRKMYRLGFLVSAIYLAAIILGLPMQAEILRLSDALPMNATFSDILTATMQNGISVSSSALWLSLASSLLILLLRILCGAFADRWYKNHVIHSVKKLSVLEPEIKEQEYMKKGLPNVYLLLLTTLAASWLPNILYVLFF
ncbi:MAG: DUF2628 domain-containing protein [Clostridia bacterium]|nr:DUF2628 domain-containing protein [Clostridia bacterium]